MADLKGEKSTTVIRGRSKDEEGMKRVDKVAISTRNPETLRYIEKKMEDKGIQRKDRHPIDGLGVHRPPPKSGHGGKFTWEGPVSEMESELDPVPPAVDPRDPNYIDEEDEEIQQKEVGEVVIGEVEVAKVAEVRDGVARVEVQPPLQP